MAIQERDIEAVAKIKVEENVELQAKKVLNGVLDMMKANPDQLDANVDEAIEYYKGVIKTDPGTMPLITPVRASAVYIEEFVRAPLSKAASFHSQPTSGVFDSISRGIYYLSGALMSTEGAISHGIPAQVMMELTKEAFYLDPSERDDYVARHRPFRTFLAERRLGIFMSDRTGGQLLSHEFDDMIDLSQGILPYFDKFPMDPNTINQTSIR